MTNFVHHAKKSKLSPIIREKNLKSRRSGSEKSRILSISLGKTRILSISFGKIENFLDQARKNCEFHRSHSEKSRISPIKLGKIENFADQAQKNRKFFESVNFLKQAWKNRKIRRSAAEVLQISSIACKKFTNFADHSRKNANFADQCRKNWEFYRSSSKKSRILPMMLLQIANFVKQEWKTSEIRRLGAKKVKNFVNQVRGKNANFVDHTRKNRKICPSLS